MNPRPLTIALLAACSLFMVSASHDAVAAPGINLSWDDCGAAGSEIKTFACDRSTGMPFTLVGSFVPPAGIDNMVGLIAEMRVSGETLPNWWEHASGSCRGSNGLSANFDFISNTTCADFLQGHAAGGFAYDIGFGAPNRARLRVIAAVPIDNKQALSPETEYYGFKVQVLPSKTTGTLRCSGCEQPMLVQLRHVQLFQPPEAANDPIIVAPLVRTRAYWQAKTPNESVPTIASFEPQRAEVGDVVEIRGDNLSQVTHVNFSAPAFDGTSDSFSIVSDDLLRATVPIGALDGPIILDGANEFVATPSAFDVVSSEPPVITSFTPTAGPPGQIVTVTGNHFRSVSSVHIGASGATFTVKSPTELEMLVPPAALTGPIRVVTSYGTTTSSQSFIVAPTITLVRPDEGIVGTRVELFGSNLQDVSSVRFFDNVTAAFEIRSADHLIATVPVNARSGPITITSPGGTHVTDVFTVVNPLAPRINSFLPRAGAPGTEVVVEGAGFIDVIRVQVVDLEASFVVNSPNRLTLTIPPNAVTGSIVVVTPQGTVSTSQEFVVAPFVTSFSPTEGAPGTTVVIEGRNFTHVGRVTFDAADALFEIRNANRIVATVPATATTGTLTVASLAGVANAGVFTVHQVLSIHSFEPPGAAPGAEVLIHGFNFQDVSSVRLGELEASFSVSSSRLIRMTVPEGALTGPIRVTTPEGTATGPGAFIVAPVITSFDPDSGGVGASIDIRGVNLENLVFVQFNSVAAPFQVLSANRILATVPPLAISGPIRVANIGGTFETSEPFVVTSTRTLRVDRFLPASGTPGDEIIVYGNKFLDVTSVRLGTLVAQFAVYGDHELRMVVPAGAVTAKVRVQTADGGSAESPTDFIVHGDEIDGGINLSWNDCGTAGNELLTFACDSNFGLPFTLIASFKPPPGVEEFLGVSADLTIAGESTLPDWWKHGAGQCRGNNGLSTDFNFNSGPFSCIDVNQGHAAGGFAYDFEFDYQRARLRVQYAVPIDNRTAVDPASEYYAFKVLLLRPRSTGGGLCDGCLTPVAITLNSLQLFQPPHRAFDPILTRPIARNSVYWQPPGDPPPTIGTNLARNSTFEASNEGWKGLPGTTLDRSVDAHEGQYALQAAAPDTAGEFGIHDTPNSVPSVPEVGSRYRFGAWLHPVTRGMRAQIRVREYLGTTRTQTVGSRKIGASGGWQYVEMEVAALNAGATLDCGIL